MGIYRFEAVTQDLYPIKNTAARTFISQVHRLKSESSLLVRPQTPGRQLVTDVQAFWTQAQEGFAMSQNMSVLKKHAVDPRLLAEATANLSFDDYQDTLRELGLLSIKDNPHATPRLSSYGVALTTLAELSRQGLTTLAGLDLPYEQTQDIPEARNHPYNWSRDLSPENVWLSLKDLSRWSRIGLVKQGGLSRTEIEQVVAATHFFGWTNHRLEQTLPSAA